MRRQQLQYSKASVVHSPSPIIEGNQTKLIISTKQEEKTPTKTFGPINNFYIQSTLVIPLPSGRSQLEDSSQNMTGYNAALGPSPWGGGITRVDCIFLLWISTPQILSDNTFYIILTL